MQTMNREQIAIAIKAGLELLSEKSDIEVPVRMAHGVHLLNLLLNGIARGEVAISPVLQQPEVEVVSPDPEPEGE